MPVGFVPPPPLRLTVAAAMPARCGHTCGTLMLWFPLLMLLLPLYQSSKC
jgi:hypothetical protein